MKQRSLFRLPDWYVDWTFRWSAAIALTVLVLTAIFLIRTAATPLSGDPVRAFINDELTLSDHFERAEMYGDDSGKVILVGADEGKSLFSFETLNALHAAQKRLLEIEEVQSVATFVDAYRPTETDRRLTLSETTKRAIARRKLLSGEIPDDKWRPEKYWPRQINENSKVDLLRIRAMALADRHVVGRLVSDDGEKHLIAVTIAPSIELSMPRQISLCREIRVILEDLKLGASGLYFAGFPVTNAAIANEIQLSFARLMPFAFALVALFMFAIFRYVRIAMLAVLIGGIAVIWGLGITSFVFGELTILVAASPLVILAVTTTDFLHIASAYQQKLAANVEKIPAIRSVVSEVGAACVLTSVTTFVGFSSLMMTRSPAVQQFGFATAVGTAVALLLMVSLLPIALRWMNPIPTASNSDVIRRTDRLIEQVVSFCARLSWKFPKSVLLAVLLICLPSIFLVANKDIDADLPSRFPNRHPLRSSLRFLESEFTGSNSIDLYVAGSTNELLNTQVVEAIREFQTATESHAEVLATSSVIDIFSAVDEVIDYELGGASDMPPDLPSAIASLDWVNLIEPRLVASTVARNRDELRIRIMLRSQGLRASNDLAKQFTSSLSSRLPSDSLTVRAGGTYQLIGNAVEDIVDSQIVGFGVCLIALTLIMAWGLGSLRVGLISQIPNLIPVLLMLAIIGLTQSRIDSDMLGLPMIALGIAVDDTIHFLHRFRLCSSKSRSRRQAVRQTFKTTGRAIVISTFALAVGLFPLALSNLLSLWMLGTYLVVGLFGALISDLLCLPAMIRMRMIDFR